MLTISGKSVLYALVIVLVICLMSSMLFGANSTLVCTAAWLGWLGLLGWWAVGKMEFKEAAKTTGGTDGCGADGCDDKLFTEGTMDRMPLA